MKLSVTTCSYDHQTRYFTRLITTCECDDCADTHCFTSAVECNEWLSYFFHNYDMEVESIDNDDTLTWTTITYSLQTK